ncbi:hypothetical protein C1930_02325 [Stenotrophomonas sp. SAU14A_NAIMI4_8]|nr:hypothetical protein C1930_02325 [Stenotrophomonas sp. SAU14A_NAIMI4_8]
MDAVMHIAPVPPLRAVALAIALLMLLGCAAQPPPPPPKVLTAEEAAARTVVPLTRPIALDKAGQIVDLEFELPPAGADLTAEVWIGVRVVGDAEAVSSAESLLNGKKLLAKVRLFGKHEDVEELLPLTRYDTVIRRDVLLDSEGFVPQAVAMSPATWPLESAGLISPTSRYRPLSLAFLSNAKPGRYRLSIELLEDRSDLKNLNVELLIGYMARSK